MASILQRIPAGFDPAGFDPAGFQTTETHTRWSPSLRIRMRNQGWFFSTRTSDRDPLHGYENRIADGRWPAVQKTMTDPVFRLQQTETIRFALVNRFTDDFPEGDLTAAFLTDLRGEPVEEDRFDEETGFVLSRFVGTVTNAVLEDGLLAIEAKNLRREVLDDQIPKLTITTADFPDARPEALGQVVRVVVGAGVNIPLYCIRDDLVNSQFWYLAPLAVGGGTVQCNALKRSASGSDQSELIGSSEYTMSLSQYPGWITINFPKRQQRWGSTELLTITGDFSCVSARDSHPVWVRAAMLTNPRWGLNQSIDMASFEAAAAVIDALTAVSPTGAVRVDGVMGEKRSAQEWLKDVGMCRGLMLGLTPGGLWTENVDAPRTPTLILRDGPGDGVRNLERCENRQRRAEPDRIKRIVFSYNQDLDGTYRGEQTFAVETDQTKGKDLLIENRMLRDRIAVAKSGQYLRGRIRWADETVDTTVLQDSREVDLATLATLTYAKQGYADAVMEAFDVTDDLTDLPLKLQGGSQALYDAIWAPFTGTLPADGPGGLLTDYSRTAPDPATAFTITSEIVSQDNQGHQVVTLRFLWNTPTTNCRGSRLAWRIHDAATWTRLGLLAQTGTGIIGEIGNVPSNTAVDLAVETENETGNLTSTPATEGQDLITNHITAPGVVPSAPSAPTKSAEGVNLATDGPASAWFDIAMPAMPANANIMRLLFKDSSAGANAWQIAGETKVGSVTLRCDKLTPGITYSVAAQGFNGVGGGAITAATSSPFVAPGDTTAPSIPTFVLEGAKLTTLTLRVTSAPPADHGWYEWELRTASSSQDASGGGSLTRGGRFTGGTLTLSAADVGYAATRYLRIRDKDASANPSTADGSGAKWTATQSFSFTEAGTVDLGSGAVTTAKVASSAITQIAEAVVDDGGWSTTIGSYVDVTGSTVTLTTQGGPIEVFFNAAAKVERTSGTGLAFISATIALLKDGSNVLEHDILLWVNDIGEARVPLTMVYSETPSAASHTYKIQALVNGTDRALHLGVRSNTKRVLRVSEFMR